MRTTLRRLAPLLLVLGGGAGPAQAGPVLDRVKASGTIHCGAAERPGLLDQPEDGAANGLLVDLCRAVGTAVAGPHVKVEVHVYDPDQSYDAVRDGSDDLSFLTGGEIADHRLAGAVLPGPAVFYETSMLMVAGGSPARTPADLAGLPVCFMQGDTAHRHLEAYMAGRHIPFVRMGYQEPVEMNDAFDAQVCKAAAGEATMLADVRTAGGPNRRGARLLDEPLATFPVLLTTGTRDGEWSAVAAWTVAVLENADRARADWTAGGLDATPAGAPAAPGLAPDWRRTVLNATGSYATILRRNVGANSPFRLSPGPNTFPSAGGLIVPPYAE